MAAVPLPRIHVVGSNTSDLVAALERAGRPVTSATTYDDRAPLADVLVLCATGLPRDGAAAVVRAGTAVVAVGRCDGLEAVGAQVLDAPDDDVLSPPRELMWPMPDLGARVDLGALGPAVCAYDLGEDAVVFTGQPRRVVVGATARNATRVAVLAVDPAAVHPQLVLNAVDHVSRVREHDAGGAGGLDYPLWAPIKKVVLALRDMQDDDGSIMDSAVHGRAAELVDELCDLLPGMAQAFPHDESYLGALVSDLRRWRDDGFTVPDFLDSMQAFDPASQRGDGVRHLVLFPMYTQNGSRRRLFEAVLIELVWPDFVADLEAGEYSNRLFLPIRFLDFTPGYDTHSAVLFPETVAMRSVPEFTWGGIFADREAARFRMVVSEAARHTRLALPPDLQLMLDSQGLTEETFVVWDLIHDRTHMRGDLPFDPFMIKQRMPFFLYSLEELRCDLTAFREAVRLEEEGLPHARLVQYAVLLDRIFRFAITGTRVRNYDALGGQLLFAWLHRARVIHWTDNRLTVEWPRIAEHVLALGAAIEDLYWRSIDRPKIVHWLAAYDLVSQTVVPHPASVWARGKDALPLTGPLREVTDLVLDDEFPLSMFFEALQKKMGSVIESTAGIVGAGR